MGSSTPRKDEAEMGSTDVQVLYTSGEIYKRIQTIFAKAKGRKVAVVAFVGVDVLQFLPKPRGVEVYCWPKAGSTSAQGIRDLQEKGASVKFVERLHSKVYWAAGEGAVVCSANLSRSALGANSLVESGVYLPDGALDIDRVLGALKPKKVTPAALTKLEVSRATARSDHRGRQGRSFLEWRASRGLPWKWSWVTGNQDAPESKAAVAWSKSTFGVAEPFQVQFCRPNTIQDHDWILVPMLTSEAKVRSVEWVYAHHVVKVSPREKAIYDRAWPRQALQAQPLKACPQPPFELDSTFKAALKAAAKAWGKRRMTAQVQDKKPTPAFLDAIAKNWPSKR